MDFFFFALSFSYKYVFVILTFPQYCFELIYPHQRAPPRFSFRKDIEWKKIQLKKVLSVARYFQCLYMSQIL